MRAHPAAAAAAPAQAEAGGSAAIWVAALAVFVLLAAAAATGFFFWARKRKNAAATAAATAEAPPWGGAWPAQAAAATEVTSAPATGTSGITTTISDTGTAGTGTGTGTGTNPGTGGGSKKKKKKKKKQAGDKQTTATDGKNEKKQQQQQQQTESKNGAGCSDEGAIRFDTGKYLAFLNGLRSKEGSPPLAWDTDAAAAAVAWAKLAGNWDSQTAHGHADGCQEYAQCCGWRGKEATTPEGAGKGLAEVTMEMWGERAKLPQGASNKTCGTYGDKPGTPGGFNFAGHYCILADPTAKRVGAGAAVSSFSKENVTLVIHVVS